MKQDRSISFFERAKEVAPGGVHSPVRAFMGVGGTPCFIERAQGAHIWDVDGNQYIDYCMGWGPLILGHVDPDVFAMTQKAMSKGWCFGTCDRHSLELAELITSHIPWVEKIRFVNSGTEAVMSALRLARAATGRDKIIKFEGCYHGHVDSMLVKAGSGLADMATPDSAGVSKAQANDTIVLPLDNTQALEKVLAEEGDHIAAVIIEPLPANNGLLIQDTDFLKFLEVRAKEKGILVIFDEVITGFRVAFGGMAELLNITPDIVTYGKVLGGGMPVGAYGASAKLMNMVAPQGAVYQAGTLAANPLAMAAGLATLRKLLDNPPYTQLQKQTEKLATSMESLYRAAHPNEKFSVKHYASLFWMCSTDKPVRSVSDIPKNQKVFVNTCFHNLLSKTIDLPPSGFEVGFVSTKHDDLMVQATLDAWKTVCES